MRQHWLLDREVVFLNHGSFGSCPKTVLDAQTRLRHELEHEPMRFMLVELEGRLDAARREASAFVGADPEGFAFVRNASEGVNAVLNSLALKPGDELLTTDHAYRACANALEHFATRSGARVVVARVPFPLQSEDEVLSAVMSAVTPRTRLALLDHITSPTGLVWPIQRMAKALAERGVETLVDGAHAPGMVELDVRSIGAAFYTGNFHKWVCAPKGAAFLWVRGDWRDRVRPVVISHGAKSARKDRSRFHLEFDWPGTLDPTAWLCVPAAIRFIEQLVSGGWNEVRRRNRELALGARRILCDALDVPEPSPESMIGSLAAVPLPDGDGVTHAVLYSDPLHQALVREHRIQTPIVPWPAPPKRLVRVSAQLYNTLDEYGVLAAALTRILKAR